MRVLRLFLSALFILIAATASARSEVDPAHCLLPKPKILQENGDRFRMRRPVQLTDPSGCTLLASLFRTSGKASATVKVCLVDDAILGTFDYALAGFPNEGYKISVTTDAITVTAASRIGVIRAAQTLMQLLAATDGAYIPGVEITDYPVYRRARAGIGYLPQEASVFRKLSVEDNIMAVLEMTGKPRTYQSEKLEALIKEFRLEKVRKNKGDQLSGGERRRTEIARCLAIEPKFIMLDEPFAGVDPIAVEDIQHIVWQLKYRNIGILITDHNVHETLNITDRAYLLFEGRILFQGKPEELAANRIVKEKYLGTNFVLQKKDFQLLDEEKRKREEEG